MPKKSAKPSTRAQTPTANMNSIAQWYALTRTDLKKELIEEFIEKGKRANFLTYEEIIAFGDKNHLAESEINEILKTLEKEHIDLIMQDELEGEAGLDGLEEETEGARLGCQN